MTVAGQKLAAWRRTKGYSQAEAAALAGVSQATWSTWESGRKSPRISAVVAVERLTRGAVRVRDWLGDDHGDTSVVPADEPRKVGT